MSLSVDDLSESVQYDALGDTDDASDYEVDGIEDAEDVTGSAESLYPEEEAGHGDDTTPEPSRQSVMWKVDHSVGEYKLKCQQFVDRTADSKFDGASAIEILQRPYTLDYGSRKSGSRPASEEDKYYPVFYLDYLSVIGRPLTPLTRCIERFFDNVTLSFRNWAAPYSSKHGPDLGFDLNQRTFRLATGSTRELWFIVMHPTRKTASRRSNRDTRQRGSALAKHHADILVLYIKEVFLMGDLLGEGIEPSWMLGGAQSQTIAHNQWAAFQERFVDGWREFAARYGYDSFWSDNLPAFHTYDYGANINIEATPQIQGLAPETRIRPDNDSDSDSSDDSGDEEEDEGSSGEQGETQRTPACVEGEDEHMSAQGLEHLRTELGQKYLMEHIETISYALAVNLHCQTNPADAEGHGDVVCLLADRNCLSTQYKSPRDYMFFPLGFHPAYGNFSSPEPPAFLADRLLAIIRDNMGFQNEGADVVSFGFFQAYSNLKRNYRNRSEDLLASKGCATAALTVPSSDVKSTARVRAKQHALLGRLEGRSTPDDPESSTPFARERQRIEAALMEAEFAFRLEQVVTIHVSRLVAERRSFRTVLQPICQMMRFFLMEKQEYVWILRRFPPEVFPGVLVAFARLFEKALGEMRQRFHDDGAQGLKLALSEATAALDRLGSFCLTGDPRVLPPRVFRPLEALDSIRHAGWPYISPNMLDMRPTDGVINLGRWPRLEDNRPVLLHVAALAYHYGPVAAANRHSQLWFAELGGRSINGIAGASRFLQEMFGELWVRQIRSFLSLQLHRQLSRGLRSGGSGPPTDAAVALREWEMCEQPFTWRQLAGLSPELVQEGTKSVTVVARRDFAEDLYAALWKKEEGHMAAFAPKHATWPAVLRAAIQHTSAKCLTKTHWIDSIAAAMQASGIEWVPGQHRQRLTHKRIIRFMGSATLTTVLSARPGSLKRAALEAEQRMLESSARKRLRKRRVDFGCELPFEAVPRLIGEGFERLNGLFSKGDHRVLEHYQLARNVPGGCLGEPLCDLMLILALTLSASSVTPFVAPKQHTFSAAPHRKDPALLAANMVTRMLWFLKPEAFPWDQDDGPILRVSEMTKKIEHKGGALEEQTTLRKDIQAQLEAAEASLRSEQDDREQQVAELRAAVTRAVVAMASQPVHEAVAESVAEAMMASSLLPAPAPQDWVVMPVWGRGEEPVATDYTAVSLPQLLLELSAQSDLNAQIDVVNGIQAAVMRPASAEMLALVGQAFESAWNQHVALRIAMAQVMLTIRRCFDTEASLAFCESIGQSPAESDALVHEIVFEGAQSLQPQMYSDGVSMVFEGTQVLFIWPDQRLQFVERGHVVFTAYDRHDLGLGSLSVGGRTIRLEGAEPLAFAFTNFCE